MTVYVDSPRWRLRNMRMCHLIADSDVELDEMALRLGLKPEWKQTSASGIVHFDVSLGKRQQAIAYGAEVVTSKELVRIARRTQGL